MVNLKDYANNIKVSVMKSRVELYEKITLSEIATASLEGVVLNGTLVSFDAIVDVGQPNVLLIIVRTRNEGHDYSYTFQFEAKYKQDVRVVDTLEHFLMGFTRNAKMTIPRADYEVIFLAERGGLAYYNTKVLGSKERIIEGVSQFLGG